MRLSGWVTLAGGLAWSLLDIVQEQREETGMIEVEGGKVLEISLKEDANGRDRVAVTLQANGCAIDLTPHQARVLATELIMAVNRAEVRSNLKHSQNVTRGASSGAGKRSLFSQAFAK